MQKYLNGIINLAIELKNTNFLVYTKKNNLNYPINLPNNLVIRFSYWNNWNNQTNLIHGAWIKGDSRIPRNSYSCPGDCRTCSYCWNSRGKNVIFKKH